MTLTLKHVIYISAKVRVSLWINFNSSGSGFMQVLQILAPIYRFANAGVKVVLLDEPDAHLHPNLQYTLAKSLREIQKELNIQIIVSTHSTAIIRAASPSEVVPVSANERISKPLSSGLSMEDEIKNRIDTYDLAKSVLSGKLVFIEDTNTEVLEYFDKVLGTKCFYGSNTVAVIRGRGKNDKTTFRLFDLIHALTGQEIEIHVIMDSDGINDAWKQRIVEYGASVKVQVHILDYHEIENYLLNPSVVHKVLATKYGTDGIPSLEGIRNRICDFGKNTITMNRYGFDDLLEDGIYQFSQMMGLSDYRNPQMLKSEAKRIRESYGSLTNYEDLIKVVMGKETLKAVNNWLTEEYRKNISVDALLNEMKYEDVHEDMRLMLGHLQSKGINAVPTRLEPMTEEADEDIEGEQLSLL